MNIKLGFLGNGNMGYAILKGLVDQGVLQPEETAVYDLLDSIKDRAAALEEGAFRATVIKAVEKSTLKALDLK